MAKACPGCHGTDFVWIRDGHNDGDHWFHCYTCGLERVVDNEDLNGFVSGANPPLLAPPYADRDPLPRSWPAPMSPRQIREWMKKHPLQRVFFEFRKRLRGY